MHIIELRMNYDRKNFFGVTESVTEYTDHFRDTDHMKTLVRKGLAFVCKEEAYGDVCFHVTFVDNNERHCYNIYASHEDRDNGTVSVRVQDFFGAYSVGEWYHVSVATMRKKLYAMCKFDEEVAA